MPLYNVGTGVTLPDLIYHDTENETWEDSNGNDLGLSYFDYDENYTGEVDGVSGDTVSIAIVQPTSWDEELDETSAEHKLVALGSILYESSTVTLEEFVTELNTQSDMQTIGVASVSGDDIAIAPSQQFTQILAALEQGGAQAEAVQTYWAQFKAALLKISNDAANAVDPDPSVNVIYNNSTVFSANAGTITYNKYN